VLILGPTRELVMQIKHDICGYCKYTKIKTVSIHGGVKPEIQIEELKTGANIIVATPGRLNDLVKQGYINLEKIDKLVLDEVDRILDSGFSKDLDEIFPKLSKQKQCLLFSATITPKAIELSKSILKNPIEIKIKTDFELATKMTQEVLFVDPENKDNLLLEILTDKKLKSTIIFTQTRRNADDIVRLLTKNDIKSIAIHSNKSQTHRTKALTKFKSGEIKILVATDLVSRGIDIEGITHIINFDIPNKPEAYIHRIGRTARNGEKGIAYSICTNYERDYLRSIEELMNKQIAVRKHELHSNRASKAKGEKAKPKFSKQKSGFLKKVKKKDRAKKSGRQY
jgi:ATP-dependent RNA helicase RhlE